MAECEVLDSMPLSPEAWQARQLAPVKGKARFSEQEIKFYKVIISYIRQDKTTRKSRYNLHKKNTTVNFFSQKLFQNDKLKTNWSLTVFTICV